MPREQRSDKGNACDIGVAIFATETQTLGQMRAHDIAVEHFDRPSLPLQFKPKVPGDCALSGT